MSYVGRLLVAPPSQDDEFWEKSVVFLYEQSAGTTVGLVLNKVSERTVKELAEHHSLEFSGNNLINIGGPLNSAALLMLHTDDWTCSNTMQVSSGLRISSDRTMLSRVCAGDTPRKWKFYMGLAGWTGDQLESEIGGKSPYSKKKAWLLAPVSERVVFEKNPEKMWETALEQAVQEATKSYFTID